MLANLEIFRGNDTDSASHVIVGARQDVGLEIVGTAVLLNDTLDVQTTLGAVTGTSGNTVVTINLEAQIGGGGYSIVDSQSIAITNGVTEPFMSILHHQASNAGTLDLKVTVSLDSGGATIENDIATADLLLIQKRQTLIPSGVAVKISELPVASAEDGTEIIPLVQSATTKQTMSRDQNNSSRGAGGFGFEWDGVAVQPTMSTSTTPTDVTSAIYDAESPSPTQLTQNIATGVMTLNGNPGAPITVWSLSYNINAETSGASTQFDFEVMIDETGTGSSYIPFYGGSTARNSTASDLVQASVEGTTPLLAGTLCKLCITSASAKTVTFKAVTFKALAG